MKIKTKKIIVLTGGLVAVGALSASIATPIVLLNKIKAEKTLISKEKVITPKEKIIEIFWKIKNKDIFISPNVSTSNQNEVEIAIKNQLQKVNPLLTNDDLSKISTNLSSLTIGSGIAANVNINVDSENLLFKIFLEKINLLKNSNIFNGEHGTIFQDSFKNLWAMGSSTTKTIDDAEKTIQTKLQVLKANQNKDGYVETGWTNDNSNSGSKLLKNSKIINGAKGIIFQDKFKNLWAMSKNSRLQVLKANQNKDGYVETGWNDSNIDLLQNLNIANGEKGTIFQDDFGNLWAMGKNSKLQVLRVNQNKDGYVETGWINDNSNSIDGLLKNSKIQNGNGGVIFQDEFKNLWTMGYSKLQVLKANSSKNGYDEAAGWTNATNSGLTKGSNIINGGDGSIFQDSFKNLWAMGNLKLQVLKANTAKDGYDETTGWISAKNNRLLLNSNISEVHDGTIFQDSFKNLWSISWATKMQVLKVNEDENDYVNTSWIKNNSSSGDPLLKNLSFVIGYGGTIFQDQFKNLWALESDRSLQILKVNQNEDGYTTTGWTKEINTKLLRNSNIDNSRFGIIFQDQFKNLWTMGKNTSLQVLRVNQKGTNYVDSWQN